ncbi:MAG: TolC family protein [Elusimicrobia bacterium]|nr:TolC family protein [Elusimicrobiota bacterium]
MRARKVSRLIFCAAFLPAWGWAQTPAWDGYLLEVLNHSPEVRQAEKAASQSQARWGAALGSGFMPSLNAGFSQTPFGYDAHNNGIFHSARLRTSDTGYDFGLQWNVFNSFRDVRRAKQARLDFDAARQRSDEVRRAVSFDAVNAYYGALLSQQLAEVNGRHEELVRERVALTEKLYKSGLKSRGDYLKTKNDWLTAQFRLVQAQALLDKARLRFNLLKDADPAAAVSLEMPPEIESLTLPDLDVSIRVALIKHPRVMAAKANNRRKELDIHEKAQNLLPSLSAHTLMNWERRVSSPDYRLELGLSLPIGFNIVTEGAQVQEARAARQETAAALEQAKRDVREKVILAYISVKESYRAHEIAMEREKIAAEDLALAREQYQQGSVDVIRLAQSEQDFLESRVEVVSTLIAYLKSVLQFKLEMGEKL